MDIEKLLKWATEYLSDYFSTFITTLRAPATRFQPVVNSEGTQHLILPSSPRSLYLNPKLFGFMLISIFIGTSLHSITFGRLASLDLSTTAIVTIAIWFAYGLTVHLFCWLLRGKATFWEVASVTLQLLSVVYVVSNFITFLWGTLAYTSMVRNLRSDGFIALLVMHPTSIYYVVQSILMAVYLPIALRNVQGFGLVRLLVVTIIPLLWASYGLYVYVESLSRNQQIPTDQGYQGYELQFMAHPGPSLEIPLAFLLVTIITIVVVRKRYSERE